MPGPMLSLVVLRCADLSMAARFYECLGLRFEHNRHGSGPEHLSANLGDTVFELYPLAPNGLASVGTRIGFQVPSVDCALASLTGFPDAILTPAQTSDWGRRAVVKDPDGHRVELLER